MYGRHLSIVERQVLADPLGSLLGGIESIPVTTPILSIPPLFPEPSSTTATPTTSSVITLSTSSVSPTTSPTPTSTTSTSSTTSSSSSSSSITPAPSTQVYTSVSGDVTSTITSIVVASATTTTTVPATSKAFLQNKPLSGSVFALAGIVLLVIIVVLSTLALRRSRRQRLQDDPISFDPDITTDAYGGASARSESFEKSGNNLGAVGSEASLIRNPNVAETLTISVPPSNVGRTQQGIYGQSLVHGYNQPYATYTIPGNSQYSPYGPPRSPNPVYDLRRQSPTSPIGPYMSHALATVPAQDRTAGLTVRALDGPESRRGSSHSRELMAQMPVAAPLPDQFGVDGGASERGSVDGDTPFPGRTLKVANE